MKFNWRKGGAGNAGPAPAAGSKEIPTGAENCLAGLTFVFTGLLESISRDEAQELVKRYGGKVTSQPSSKTSYVILGSDAGPSKLEKIQKMSIKTLNEDGLFELIRCLPANGGDSKAAEKSMEKKRADGERIRREAAEMERDEKRLAAETKKTAEKAALARGLSVNTGTGGASQTSQLWTVKYAPTKTNQFCGNKAQVEKIQNWLAKWHKSRKFGFALPGPDGSGKYRAIIIHGPAGIGKTTAAHLAAKLEGYDIIETNASDTRSKRLVETSFSDILHNSSLLGFFAGDGMDVDMNKKKIVLIMDEVDGMSAGDRGGVGALAKICKKTEVPIILICNERKLPKMKPFDYVTYDIQFKRPSVEQIRSRIATICARERLSIPVQVIDALVEGSNRDIRQVINMLSTAKLDQTSMDFDQGKSMSKAWEKHIILKPWDICHKLLGSGLFAPSSKATLNDKIELYFHDHEFSYLMIQENYLSTRPLFVTNQVYSPREQKLKLLELADKAAESISDGDLVDRMIHGSQQHWSLMPVHAVFSSVRPSSFVSGSMTGNSSFTQWLGNNSKFGKYTRYVKEIQSHMRLRSSGDRNEIRQQYLPVLWTRIIKRLENEGKNCVEEVINLMDSYFLTRDDFEYIMELALGPQRQENVELPSATKASFTRV
jgi:replication factor C subunit 1